MDINWDGLKSRNLFADFQGGAELGKERRQTNLKREVLNVFATDPAKAEQMAMQMGDLETAEAIRKRREATTARNNRGLVGVVAQTNGPAVAQQKALQVGQPELAEMYGKMDESQKKAAAERAGVLVAYLDSFQGKGEPEILAQIQQDAPALMELGFTEQQIRGFRPTPQNIAMMRTQALGLKGELEQRDRVADNQRQDATLAEQRRANQAREGISRGQLGVAQSNAARGWAAHNERKRAGGYGTPGVGSYIADDDVEIDP